MRAIISRVPAAHFVAEAGSVIPASPNRDSCIYIAGHRGLAGSAIERRLKKLNYRNLVTRARGELDLRDPGGVDAFFAEQKPEFVFLAAARVGGIMTNHLNRGDFIRDNLQIQLNVIDAARRFGVRKLLFLGSACIYPRDAPQPLREEYVLTGPLEPTNSAYAVAKIAGLEMIDAYRAQFGFNGISIMPTNLYGPRDNFDLETSHVLPALIRRFHDARAGDLPTVTIWGTGSPLREFMHCDDLADAAVWLMENYDEAQILNVGTGDEISILDLARLVAKIIGFRGDIVTDPAKPDGTPRKLCDVSKLAGLGWKSKIGLEEGIASTYGWFVENAAE